MTESNFVSEADFEKLLNSLPSQSNAEKLHADDWRMFYRVMYGCALRIKETVGLKPENFDLEHKILTLPETKTGWRHCKCSKWKSNAGSRANTILVSVDKNCKKCNGEAWIRVVQRTTILPKDAVDLKAYLDKKQGGQRIWPISRQTAWFKFKKLCELSGLSYFWQKRDRAFDKGWPYLLRSSRAKIMEDMGAKHSLVKLKLRHTLGGDVTLAYTMPDIHALLGWEAEHYPFIGAVVV